MIDLCDKRKFIFRCAEFNADTVIYIHLAWLWKFLTLLSSYVEFIVDNRGVPAGNNKAISGMEEILPAY